jgi:putative nucleotidyltransferase with HDIG domain
MQLPRKHAIAIVCANDRQCRQLREAAAGFYDFVEYRREVDAFAGIAQNRPSVLLVGEQLSPDGGLAFLGRLRHQPAFADLPVIFVTGAANPLAPAAGLGEAAILVVGEPFHRTGLIKAIGALVNADVQRGWRSLPDVQRRVLDDSLAAFNRIATLIESDQPIEYKPVEAACRSVVAAINDQQFHALLTAVRDHDDYSFSHSLRVATLLSLFGHTIGLSAGDQLLMASGGLLHDVGKITIPHALLNKPGRLSEAEMAVMRGHVGATAQILKRGVKIPKGVVVIAANHHEKLDGSGYPNGLRASQLDELARMSAIVDVFSAMTDRRLYKPAMTAEQAFRLIVETMGRQLDMHLLALFREVLLDATRTDPESGPRRQTA